MELSPAARRRFVVAVVVYVNLLSLACQLLWVRRFNVLFGSTAAVFSSVLCAFLLGLALGADFGGRRFEATRRPWRLLGWLLTLLGGYVFVSLRLFDLARWIYLQLAPSQLSPFATALSKLPWVLLLVVPPTALIGAVLPGTIALLSREGAVGRTVAVLYAADTLGAGAGALIGGFVLVPRLGLAASTWLLGVLCAGLGLWVMRQANGWDAEAEATAAAALPPPQKKKRKAPVERKGSTAAGEGFAPPQGWRARAILLSFFCTGAAALLLETGWNRFFYLLNGTSIFSLTVVLTGFLSGIGLGSILVRRRLDRGRDLFVLICYLQLMIAVGGVLVLRSENLFSRRYLAIFQASDSYFEFQALVYLLVFFIVCTATVAMGANFPAVTRLLSVSRERAGSSAGRVYMINTAGAVLGAFLGEFVVLPRIGFAGLMTTVTAIYLASAVLFASLSPKRARRHAVPLGALALAAILLTPPLRAFEPPSNAVYYTGVRRGSWDSYAALNASLETIWRRQGFYGQVSVLRGGDGTLYLKHNGKTDASSSTTDNFAQLMLGHLPLLLHPDAKSVLNIGLGGGITLGAIVGHPAVSEIVQVEIDPLMAEAAKSHFAPFNRDGLEAPRVRLVVDDGRNFVQRGGRRFDVIVSEPPNIWVSGVSGLFTQEFYQSARERLSPGGLLCQWLPLYELDADDFAAALRTIGSVFPHLMVWTNGAVAIVIASETPIQPPANLDQVPPAAFADLASVGIAGTKLLDYLRKPDLSAAQVESWRARGPFVNRDDRPLLEFHCARNLFLQQKARDPARWRAGLSKDR